MQALEGAEGLVTAVTATEELDEKITLFAPAHAGFEEISDVIATLTPEDIWNVRPPFF